MQQATQPSWPIMMTVSDSDELVLLPDLDSLQQELAVNLQYQHLIDSNGYYYQVAHEGNAIAPHKLQLAPLNKQPIAIADLLDKVRRHASLVDQCCSAKMTATEYGQVFEMLAYLD
ncbi:DUF4144 family protein [Shewanella waksmanii]|uniref:DUF4144 family protein n=1 Tax=Shewanella waksmanii TaxID=213783 RepID=UPI003735D890